MVVLVPMFEGEKTKVCPECGMLGMTSQDVERTSFYLHGRKGTFRRQCRRCWSKKTYRQQRAQPEPVDTVPEHLAWMTEDERIDWHLERERRGIPLSLPPPGRPVARGRPAKYALPIEPVRAWIEGLIEREMRLRGKPEGDNNNKVAIESAVAEQLDIGEKMLWRWRYEVWQIDERWVDHATRSEGSIRPEDLYPELECVG